MNKLRAFLLRRFAKQAIAAGPSTFDMSQVLDNGGLCLARLPKGRIRTHLRQLQALGLDVIITPAAV